MTVEAFPPVEEADEYGLLAVGGDLEADSLLMAYRSGIFPWPLDAKLLTWFAPPRRAILRLKDFHVSRRLGREYRSTRLRFRIDTAFSRVITACASSSRRREQRGTWITPEMVQAYIDFHRAGYAHSIEAWFEEDLVGGLYGVAIGKMFAGESMFFTRTNASKLALCYLVDHMRERGAEWIDCQVMTPLFESFGAVEIERKEFQSLLATTIAHPPIFP